MANWRAGRCLIKGIRISLGWTQKELSIKSGVPQSTISALERNRYVLDDLSIARSLAAALGVNIDDLYEWFLLEKA